MNTRKVHAPAQATIRKYYEIPISYCNMNMVPYTRPNHYIFFLVFKIGLIIIVRWWWSYPSRWISVVFRFVSLIYYYMKGFPSYNKSLIDTHTALLFCVPMCVLFNSSPPFIFIPYPKLFDEFWAANLKERRKMNTVCACWDF